MCTDACLSHWEVPLVTLSCSSCVFCFLFSLRVRLLSITQKYLYLSWLFVNLVALCNPQLEDRLFNIVVVVVFPLLSNVLSTVLIYLQNFLQRTRIIRSISFFFFPNKYHNYLYTISMFRNASLLCGRTFFSSFFTFLFLFLHRERIITVITTFYLLLVQKKKKFDCFAQMSYISQLILWFCLFWMSSKLCRNIFSQITLGKPNFNAMRNKFYNKKRRLFSIQFFFSIDFLFCKLFNALQFIRFKQIFL